MLSAEVFSLIEILEFIRGSRRGKKSQIDANWRSFPSKRFTIEPFNRSNLKGMWGHISIASNERLKKGRVIVFSTVFSTTVGNKTSRTLHIVIYWLRIHLNSLLRKQFHSMCVCAIDNFYRQTLAAESCRKKMFVHLLWTKQKPFHILLCWMPNRKRNRLMSRQL